MQARGAFSLGLICLAPLAIVAGAPTLATAQTTPQIWGSIPLPGGTAAARDALDLGDPRERLDETVLLDFVRRYANTDLRSAGDRFAHHLRTATTANTAPSDALPLPLPTFWARTYGDTTLLLARLIRNRGALLTYHGLMGLDEDTLAILATRPALLRTISANDTAAGAFATFGSSLRLGPRGVITPGDDADVLWRRLVGTSPTDIDAFTRALFGRDEGRLAWFYDTVAGLPPATQRFVLASHLAPDARLAAVRAIYARFTAADPGWRIATRPFYRPVFDAAIALLVLDPEDDGTVGPAWWPAAFDAAAGTSRDNTRATASDRAADARWFFDWVFAVPDAAQTRFAAIRFARRLFADTPREAAPHVQAAIAGVLETPLVMMTAERMGVRDPAMLGAVAHAASAARSPRQSPALARWQAALGLLEQVQRWVTLPEARLAPLLQTLLAIAPGTPGASDGSVAAWIDDHLLPALIPASTPPAAIEEAFLRAATTSPDAPPASIIWEGQTYRLDTVEAARVSATTIRQAFAGPRLQDLLEISRVRRAIDDAKDPTTTRPLIIRLERIAPAIARIDHRDDRRIRDYAQMIRAIGGSLGNRLGEYLSTIDGAVDAVTETVTASLLYALAASPAAEPILYAEAWSRHSLDAPTGLSSTNGRSWRDVAWQFPTDYGLGGGTQLIGAFLAVDVALADARLIRVAPDTPNVPGVIDDPIRRGLVERLVFDTPHTSQDDIPVTLGEDVIRGRAMVSSWTTTRPDSGDVRARLRAAGTDAWRANVLAWIAGQDRSDWIASLTATEAAGLGARASGREGPLLRWSGSSRPIDGCLCAIDVRSVTSEQLRGRRRGVQALRPHDVTVRLVEALATIDLDASLAPILLPMAFQDWLGASRPAWPDDSDAFVHWPRELSIDRVEAYLMHLISTGVLAVPSGEETRP